MRCFVGSIPLCPAVGGHGRGPYSLRSMSTRLFLLVLSFHNHELGSRRLLWVGKCVCIWRILLHCVGSEM